MYHSFIITCVLSLEHINRTSSINGIESMETMEIIRHNLDMFSIFVPGYSSMSISQVDSYSPDTSSLVLHN